MGAERPVTSWRTPRCATVVAIVVLAVGAVVAVAGCVGGGDRSQGDGPSGAGAPRVGMLSRVADPGGVGGRGGVALDERGVAPFHTGRFRMRVQRGVAGLVDVDFTLRGAFDTDRAAAETVIDLWAMTEPMRADGSFVWPAGFPTDLMVRRIGHRVYVDTGRDPLPWVVFPEGGDPFGASDIAAAFDPLRLVDVLRDAALDVTTSSGGSDELVDGPDTVRHSGWIRGRALADQLDGGGVPDDLARLAGIGGVAVDELADRLVRFDLWVGVTDGVPRRLVVELDLDHLAEMARRLDGTDEGIHRLRYRTEVEWSDIGLPVDIEEPPPHLVGVIDTAALVP